MRTLFLKPIIGIAFLLLAIVSCKEESSTGADDVEKKLPVVTTAEVTDVTLVSATSGGNVTNDGGSLVTSRGVCWNTTGNPTIKDSITTDGDGAGVFTSSITGLTNGTKYYVRAYATNKDGTSYGLQYSFTTVPITLPVISTVAATSVSWRTATSGGNITSDGNGTITDRGICWSTNPNPTINDVKTSEGTGTGEFSSNLTGLEPSTAYYVRSFATNSAGTGYGNEVSFTTKAPEVPSLTTSSITEITKTSAKSGGTILSDGGSTIIEKGVCWSTNPNPTINDVKTSDGSGKDAFISELSNLSTGTNYYIRSYATNAIGTGYGNLVIFRTFGELIYEGFTYTTVRIGTQEWTVENLRTTRYNDGTSIENLKDSTAWSETQNAAYCAYNNDENNVGTYGYLYNWYAVNTGKLAPSGWHVPSDEDWTKLTDFIGGEETAGYKLKTKSGWYNSGNGSNIYSFSALPSGARFNADNVVGGFLGLGGYGFWWSSNSDGDYAAYREVAYDATSVYRGLWIKGNGFSIRLVRDVQ